MKKVAIFTVADNNNLQYYEKFKNSLRKWHPEGEVDLLLVTETEIAKFNDPKFFYRAKPLLASQLLGQYEVIIGMDCDQVVCGDISTLWADSELDVLCVHNSNPKEAKSYPVQVWDIGVNEYLNAGLVVMRSEKFIKHWAGLCMSPRFDKYQMGEQDLLNIMVYYGDYKVGPLDSGDGFWGLSSKGYWPNIELRADPLSKLQKKLVLPRGGDWPQDKEKTIKVIHWAGGNVPGKMNFKLNFQEDVAEWLEELCQKTK